MTATPAGQYLHPLPRGSTSEDHVRISDIPTAMWNSVIKGQALSLRLNFQTQPSLCPKNNKYFSYFPKLVPCINPPPPTTTIKTGHWPVVCPENGFLYFQVYKIYPLSSHFVQKKAAYITIILKREELFNFFSFGESHTYVQ